METLVKNGDSDHGFVVELNKMDHALHLLDRMEKMRRENEQCDFTIEVQGEKLQVHRSVLCSFSDYFDAMLRHDTKERQLGLVEMKDVDFESVKACVEYMYTAKLSVSQDKYEDVMHTAHMLQLQKLCDAVAALLETSLDTKSFFSIRRIAVLYGCRKLQERCAKFAAQNLGKLATEEQFLDIDKEYILELLSLPAGNYVSERIKMEALLTWVEHDSARHSDLKELVGWISLGNVPIGYRRFLIESKPLICQDCEVLKEISISVMDSLNVKSADFSEETVNGICVFDKASGFLSCYNTVEKTWSQMQEINDDMKQNRFSAVSFENFIFVLMGNKSLYRLDYQDRNARWEKMADMNDDHGWCPPATVLADSIYVMGGHNHCATKSCERYDIGKNAWEKLPDKRHPSQFTEIYGFGENVFSLGGRMAGSYSKKLACFNTTSLTWSEMAPMKEQKGGSAAAFHGNKLCVFGGHLANYEELSTIELYDPQNDTWSDLPPMKDARSWFNVHEIDGVFYAVGGYKSQNFIERMDLDSGARDIVKLPNEMIAWNSVKVKL